jgi:hypothetical protein
MIINSGFGNLIKPLGSLGKPIFDAPAGLDSIWCGTLSDSSGWAWMISEGVPATRRCIISAYINCIRWYKMVSGWWFQSCFIFHSIYGME